ncbi:MAG: Holliday junction resolvase RuvX [Chitinispirillaceae bacterium]|nr:Holliday junction resolvase RuvX [Chitinispirillaceae bacterium]
MRLISIDYGRRRIGLAVGDDQYEIVRGLTTIDRKKCKDVEGLIAQLINLEKAEGLVVGLPLDINDDETQMAKEIKEFAKRIAEKSNLPIFFIDESHSSLEASEIMRYYKKSKRKDKSNLDKIAACLLLERYFREK